MLKMEYRVEIISNTPQLSLVLQTALLNMHAKCGNIEQAGSNQKTQRH